MRDATRRYSLEEKLALIEGRRDSDDGSSDDDDSSSSDEDFIDDDDDDECAADAAATLGDKSSSDFVSTSSFVDALVKGSRHVRCVCGTTNASDYPGDYRGLWLECAVLHCAAWQHAVCFGIGDRSKAPCAQVVLRRLPPTSSSPRPGCVVVGCWVLCGCY